MHGMAALLKSLLPKPTTPRARLVVMLSVVVWLPAAVSQILITVLFARTGAALATYVGIGPQVLQHILLLPVLTAVYLTARHAVHILRPWVAMIAVQILLALAFAGAVRTFLFIAMFIATGSINTDGTRYSGLIDATFGEPYGWICDTITYLTIYLLGLFLVLGVDAYLDLEQERAAAADLKLKWLDARLATLRAQLNPHFFFNSLHSVSALVLSNPQKASALIADLGDLFRITLREHRDFVPLEDELSYIEQYLKIEAVRFQDKLTTFIQADPAILGATIPSLILLPLAENAITHGVMASDKVCDIKVTARRNGDTLELSVSNTFFPGDRVGKINHGTGLRNVRDRLTAIYGNRFTMSVGAVSDANWLASVSLPCRLAPASS